MGRIYRVPFNAVAVTAQQDLFEITALNGTRYILPIISILLSDQQVLE